MLVKHPTSDVHTLQLRDIEHLGSGTPQQQQYCRNYNTPESNFLLRVWRVRPPTRPVRNTGNRELYRDKDGRSACRSGVAGRENFFLRLRGNIVDRGVNNDSWGVSAYSGLHNYGPAGRVITAAAQAGADSGAIDLSLPTDIRTSVYGVLLRRLSPAVRAGYGIEINTLQGSQKQNMGASGVLPGVAIASGSQGETAKEARREASSFSGRVELNSSWRKRPDDVKRDTLPVVWSPTWGCTVLIDTGSTSTIIKEKIVRNRGWQSQVKLCTCVATTVAGPTPLSGELVLSLKGLSGKNRSVVAHVMDWASNEYDAILGTDALRSEGGVSRSGYVGAAVVKNMDHIRANDVTQHFEAVIHTEGEPLSVTGRVRHEIDIPDDRVVYIKPRRYPQTLVDVIRQELKDLFDQGIIRKSISTYCSPLWVVPKPPDAQGNLRHRVVVDYKELNKHTRSEKYPHSQTGRHVEPYE
ncbi:hypothetical protein AAG570_013322 [Ranatra chinensis]|uniref:Peptidase A2 domain-containing protein n=1 Tax=Ranatra chinensis TaxID=642074 RepID=A0ABD0YIF2_9HEMI